MTHLEYFLPFPYILTFPWPARSPNSSPIKHTLDNWRRHIGQPTSLLELAVRLQKTWNEMSQSIKRNLHALMLARITSCSRAIRSTTEY
ncbi:hypothetical protein TNCV_3800321 [Trichonephila clavipes]|nr:hypothetical protein TNCV_3800321 [Trichonephila clavipes]